MKNNQPYIQGSQKPPSRINLKNKLIYLFVYLFMRGVGTLRKFTVLVNFEAYDTILLTTDSML